ncbi:uncharacterized protein LOC117212613 [Bombus bifarius]|uniref:Uncharacterized protein LOC117212613 n=2 Tax=Pyrobombus TaxID=144703 RepID=A0A6P8NG26_9HYME|nr:uncharacterized protein LOC117212613 [Bombus bifarius]
MDEKRPATAKAHRTSQRTPTEGPLQEIRKVKIRKGVTGSIILEVPGDKEREKAPVLAVRLTQALDPTTVKVAASMKTAELRVTNIDISVGKEELRDSLARAGGCKALEVRVGDFRTSRGGLGSAWIRCPTATARKLSQAGRVIVGWLMARVEAIGTRESDLRIYGRPEAAMLQMRGHRSSGQELLCLHVLVPAL